MGIENKWLNETPAIELKARRRCVTRLRGNNLRVEVMYHEGMGEVEQDGSDISVIPVSPKQ